MDGKRQQQAPSVPGSATQGAEAPDLSWAEASIWTERMALALVNGVKGGRWFSLIDTAWRPATLALAFEKVKANRGAAGVDGESVERFAARAEIYLSELSEELRNGSFRPQAIRRVSIPKGDGRSRPLGIPTVKDRVVQTAVKLVIEPIFETMFSSASYGFRPERSCKDALREVDRLIKEGYVHVVDADLKSYFDSIPHGKLMKRVEEKIADGRLLDLLRAFLEADVLDGIERWTPTGGAPQGAVISPLLANVYLHPLDELMASKGYRMVRYADDFVVLCRSPEDACAALTEVKTWVEENGLALHEGKTHVGDCRKSGQGFEFLGYRFEGLKRFVRKKSVDRLKDKVREKTKRTRGDSLARIVADLNPVLRGWFNYFKHARPSVFRSLDGFIRRRLRAILRKQEKRPGFGICKADHQRFTNAFFAKAELVALHASWCDAKGSR